ncbi:S-adenosyl-L-methionine-dependent methyltransferase [Wolfiporia cocos MD-104 SS10]|uniref:S-adenosyl-L-methionine-dependent methyltransferase n=1 Tax=Wolfiporia cocos (strain MD-104) TaxID=742152 RepID=A0A2H3JKK3_WOLCO|nr:S-adenosyl-L-methionine-dependent methyltransferase [Wolfiporia cocos MD-104 SS10]
MATFAKTTFNEAKYAAARPTYPKQFYDSIFRFHERAPGARWDTAVDLGCGTGQATLELTPFRSTIGIDPSAKMIEQAQRLLEEQTDSESWKLGLRERVKYVQGSAEDLSRLANSSIDMIVSAQAAHWFDWAKLWPEAARVLRKNGTLAVWGYSQFRVAGYPTCTPLINAYSGVDSTSTLGPYWEQPGRTILDEHLQAIPDPRTVDYDGQPGASIWSEFQRVYYVGAHHPALPHTLPALLRKRTTWAGVLHYLRTFSALYSFHEAHPDDLHHPAGDVAVRFWRALRAEVAQQKGRTGEEDEAEEIEIEWPMAVLLARRA